jgi:hypothetical protein
MRRDHFSETNLPSPPDHPSLSHGPHPVLLPLVSQFGPAAREMQLADVGAMRQTRTLGDLQHQHIGAARRLPRKLLAKTVAQMAVNKGDSAAQLAQRVTDMYVRSIVPPPVLSPSSPPSSSSPFSSS